MKKLCFLVASFFLLTILALTVYAETEKKKISESVLRFHVVAESNSDKDQMIKLKVRDRVLSEVKVLFREAKDKKEAMKIAEENKLLIKEAAETELKKAGCNLPVTVSIGKECFPFKEYENIRLPGGVYDSVTVKIGEAKGANWWCIMYPALCFQESLAGRADVKGEKLMKSELGEERFRLITDTSDAKIRIKFKILELF